MKFNQVIVPYEGDTFCLPRQYHLRCNYTSSQRRREGRHEDYKKVCQNENLGEALRAKQETVNYRVKNNEQEMISLLNLKLAILLLIDTFTMSPTFRQSLSGE